MELEIELNGKPCKVKMEGLTFGERNEALRKSTNVDLATQTAKVDTILFGEWRLIYSIKDMEIQGWKSANTDDAKLKLIRGMALRSGDVLSQAEQKLNLGDIDKKK